MKVTVTTLNDEIFVLDVSEDLELENFKAFCEIESGFQAKEITLNFEGKPLLDDKKSLKDHGVHDGDVLVLLHMVQSSSELNATDANQSKWFLLYLHFKTCLVMLACCCQLWLSSLFIFARMKKAPHKPRRDTYRLWIQITYLLHKHNTTTFLLI